MRTPRQVGAAPARSDDLERYLASLGAVAHRHGQLRLDADGRVVGRFYRCELTTRFENLWALDRAQVIGAEAQLVCYDADGEGVLPWRLFMQAATDDQAVALDRLSRTVHALNYVRQSPRPETLWLRVHPRLVQAVATDHGRAFGRVLDALQLPRSAVVIELDAATLAQPVLAIHACANYRLHGFKVALALGGGPRCASVIETARPDIVTVDVRELHARAGASAHLLAMARARGARSLARQVSGEADQRAAERAGVTWVSAGARVLASAALACRHTQTIVGPSEGGAHNGAALGRIDEFVVRSGA